MELWILNRDLEQVGIVDTFKSLIWTTRHTKVGDCEIYVPASVELLQILRKDYYIFRQDSDMICRIKSIEIDTDVETGNYLIVKGYDCKDILAQRIIFLPVTFRGTAENFIRKIINDNVLTEMLRRTVPKFKLADSHGFSETIDIQARFDSVLERVQAVCDTYGYGFKVTFDGTDFVFDLYKGIDRSVDQDENDYVLFSPDFENLKSTTYSLDATNVANAAYVAGEGEGSGRIVVGYEIGEVEGLDRCEIYVDARDLSTNEGEIPFEDYVPLLRQRGAEKLTEYGIVTEFDGEVEPNRSYVFGVDYFLGDIVTVRNEYGIQINARVTEVIEAYDDNGHTIIPKFEFMEVQQ
ncbi:MAG: siphovirus ReqiPepy6 Gp37-like family protein [Bacteroidaceae bacterium]|nr:siphovirus ReqiPepy6 Gp37-like family protein [Bacteroidaceae bacterium]